MNPQPDCYDEGGIPIGVVLWRLRRAIGIGGVFGLLVACGYLFTKTETATFTAYLDTPTVSVSDGAVTHATAKDTGLIVALMAEQIESSVEGVTITAKEADRAGQLVKLELTVPVGDGAAVQAEELAQLLLRNLNESQERAIAPLRAQLVNTGTRLDSLVQALSRLQDSSPSATDQGFGETYRLGLLAQYNDELTRVTQMLASIRTSSLVGPLTKTSPSAGWSRSAGVIVGGGFAGCFFGLALGWLASELALAAQQARSDSTRAR